VRITISRTTFERLRRQLPLPVDQDEYNLLENGYVELYIPLELYVGLSTLADDMDKALLIAMT